MRRLVAVAAGVVVVAGSACGGRSGRPRADAVTIGTTPTTLIRPDSLEMNGIHGVVRLSNGDLLVGNSGGKAVLAFNVRGEHTATTGRKGSGPGDFEGSLRLVAGEEDTVLVYDTALGRWSVLAPDGRFVRVVPAGDEPPLPTWLYRGAMVTVDATGPVAAWVLPVLDRARAADPDYRHLINARVDRGGLLWVADSSAPTAWTVFGGADDPGRGVTLPDGSEWAAAGPDYMALIVRDSLDVERVEVRRLSGLDRSEHDRSELVAVTTDTTPVARRLAAAFPRLMMAQELFFSTHGHYTTTPDSLSLKLEGDWRLLLSGGPMAWLGVLADPTSGTTCAVSVGLASPAGWLDGTPFCTSVHRAVGPR